MKFLLPLLLLFPCFLTGQDLAQVTDSSVWSIDIDEVVVTAQYAPTSSRNALHRIRRLDRQDIEQRGAVTLDQLLRQELNIRINQDMVLGSSLSLNGVAGQNVQIMIDGVPVIGRVGDDIDLSQINLNQIERVEIVEGPLSVQYGTNALGGVVNLITQKSQLKKFEASVETQYQSIGWKTGNASLGYRPTDRLLLQLQGGRTEFNGYNPVAPATEAESRTSLWNPKDQTFLGGALRYNLADDHFIRYSINGFDEEVRNLGAMRRPQFKPYAFDDFYRTRRLDQALHQEGSLGEDFYLKTTAGYNRFRRIKNTYRLDFESEEQNEVPSEQDTTRFNTYMLRPVLASKFANSKLNFQLGLDLRYENGFGPRIQDESSDRENYSEQGDYALFGSLQFQPTERLSMQAGARMAHNTRYEAPVTPSFNLKYDFSPEFTLRASYARGFRAPSLKELFFYFVDANHFILGNEHLQAETSDNVQLTLDWRPEKTQGRFEASLTAFFNDIHQKIDLFQFEEVDGEMVPVTDGNSNSVQYAYFNQARFKTLGSNLRLRYTFDRFDLSLGYSPIGIYNPLSENDPAVGEFSFVHEANGEFSYRLPWQDIRMTLFFRYNDRLLRYYQDIDDNTGELVTGEIVQDGFTLADLTLSKSFAKDRFQLTAGVQNLFDVRSVNIAGGFTGTHSGGDALAVGTGRAWFVRMNVRLGWN